MGERRFPDWTRVTNTADGQTGVVGNYNPKQQMYLVIWDDGSWSYNSYHELRKESES